MTREEMNTLYEMLKELIGESKKDEDVKTKAKGRKVTHSLGCFVTEEDFNRVNEIAHKCNINRSTLIRIACKEFCDKHDIA